MKTIARCRCTHTPRWRNTESSIHPMLAMPLSRPSQRLYYIYPTKSSRSVQSVLAGKHVNCTTNQECTLVHLWQEQSGMLAAQGCLYSMFAKEDRMGGGNTPLPSTQTVLAAGSGPSATGYRCAICLLRSCVLPDT